MVGSWLIATWMLMIKLRRVKEIREHYNEEVEKLARFRHAQALHCDDGGSDA